MAGSGGETVGSRIAAYRKLAGYTQREFADHAHLSLGAIRKVEQGERLPTYGFLNTVARTLAVSVEELTGQPYRGRERADARVQCADRRDQGDRPFLRPATRTVHHPAAARRDHS